MHFYYQMTTIKNKIKKAVNRNNNNEKFGNLVRNIFTRYIQCTINRIIVQTHDI